MNNYILNSGSFTYSSKTYNYVETNNHYNFPYVFKTDLSSDPIIYVKLMSPYGSGLGTGGSFSPDGTNGFGPLMVYYTVKAWGVATIKEAAEIGGATSDSSLLIIKSSLSEYNCLLKDTTAIEYDSDNLCVSYVDIRKKIPSEYILDIVLNTNGNHLGIQSGNKDLYDINYEGTYEYYDQLKNSITINVDHINTDTNEIGNFYQDPDEGGTTFQKVTKLLFNATLSNSQTVGNRYRLTYNWSVTSDTTVTGTTPPIKGHMVDAPRNLDTFYSTTYKKTYTYEFQNATVGGSTIIIKFTI